MNDPRTLKLVRSPSRPLDAQLESCIAINGSSGILNVYAQGKVVTILDSIVTLSEVTLYSINENKLIQDGDVILTLDTLKVTITPSLVEIYKITIGSVATLLVHLKNIQNVEVTAGGFSRLPEYVGIVVNASKEIERLIPTNEDILAFHAKLKHYISKAQYSKGILLPVDFTKDSLILALETAQKRISMLVEAYPEKFKAKPIDVGVIETERTGLKQFLMNCERSNTDPLVIMKAKLVTITEATVKTRLIFQDLSIREYDSNIPFNDSRMIDKLDHLNVYVDQKFIDTNDLISYLPTYGSMNRYVYLLARINTYARNSYRASLSSVSTSDVGLALLNYSPVFGLVNEVLSYLPQWEDLILNQQTLVGSGDLTKKITKRIDKINSYDKSFINTHEVTLDQLDKTIAELNERYDICMSKRAELVEKQQAEENQAKLQAGLEYLLELSDEAIAYFRTGQLV